MRDYVSLCWHALLVTLPGYQGLYFQGAAENLKTEDFAFEAQKYRSKMIILAPQLNDWGETSANQTIELVEYFLKHYKINPARVYIDGYSGGGETLSIVLGKRPIKSYISYIGTRVCPKAKSNNCWFWM